MAVTVAPRPDTVRSRLLLVPTCSMVTVFDPLPMYAGDSSEPTVLSVPSCVMVMVELLPTCSM